MTRENSQKIATGKAAERLRHHYEVERELADRLRAAGPDERQTLYPEVYAELVRRLPNASFLQRTEAEIQSSVRAQMAFLRRFLRPDAVFLEIGGGRCALSLEAAKYVKTAHAIDVAETIPPAANRPDNFRFNLFDGLTLPLPDGSIDVAYSSQVVEHLHPDDCLQQIQDVHRVLVASGVYVCATPNRLSGPWDVSRGFDKTATGLHLKEYTNTEMAALFKKAGLSRVVTYAALKRRYASCPLSIVALIETVLGVLPHAVCRALAGRLPLRALLGIYMAAVK